VYACANNPAALKDKLASDGFDFSEEGIIHYCMQMTPRKALENLLETRYEIINMCELLEIDGDISEPKQVLLDRICAHIIKSPMRFDIFTDGFAVLYDYVRHALHRSGNIEHEQAMNCLTRLEELIKDFYKLIMGEILYGFLDESMKTFCDNAKQDKLKFGNCLDQLEKAERMLQSNPSAQLHLIHHTHSSSIFGSSNPAYLRRAYCTRNKIAHQYEPNKTLKKKECLQICKDIEAFLKEFVATAPIAILPVHFGMNEWGVKYLSYIDETDIGRDGRIRSDSESVEDGIIRPQCCKQIYFLERKIDFLQLQRAYIFHTPSDRILYDLDIYYQQDLWRTRYE
jgi:uncharacterized protein YutE (UPF0331/DUF86 family)